MWFWIAFGPSRLMIGSDWPVCTVSADYAATVGIVLEFIAQLTNSERDAVLGGTCAEVYRIETEHTEGPKQQK